MPVDGIFCPHIHRTPPPIGPTLVMLGNARRNVVRSPPQYHTVVRNNCTIYGRTEQSNIPHPRSANNGAMAHTTQPEGSSRGNRRANQSNSFVLPFLDTLILGRSS
jgi:hypothetical protein